MDWPTVIKSLHDESVRDASRSRDALTIQRDQMSAIVYSISSVLCNRVAKALEDGLVMGMSHVTIDGEPSVEENAKGKVKKGGRTSKTPNFIRDNDFKPKKRGRPRKDAA